MNHKQLKKECDALWFECVKARAGYKSEYSGNRGKQVGGEHSICGHHICGKGSYALRYSIENGMCLTNGEHMYIAHRQDRESALKAKIEQLRGADFFEKIADLKWQRAKTDLFLIKIYLQQQLEGYQEKFNKIV